MCWPRVCSCRPGRLASLAQQVAAWTAWVSAVVIGALAVAAIVAFTEWEEWVNLALGIWVVLAPWILGFTGVTYARSGRMSYLDS